MNAVPLWVSASASFYGTSANSVNRSPIEAGNNQMLCPSIGACNRNNFATHSLVFACCDAAPSMTRGATLETGRMIHRSVILAAPLADSSTSMHFAGSWETNWLARCASHRLRFWWMAPSRIREQLAGALPMSAATWKGWRRMFGRRLPLASR